MKIITEVLGKLVYYLLRMYFAGIVHIFFQLRSRILLNCMPKLVALLSKRKPMSVSRNRVKQKECAIL